MNDTTINTQQPQQSNGGMNTMMIVGAVVVLAIIGFFVIKSTAKQPSQEASSTTNSSANSAPSETTSDADGDADNTMMAPDSTTSDTSMMASDSSMMADTSTDASQTQVVNIEGGSFYYKPNTITVKKGQKVKVVMKSVDMMHDFVIDELNVKMPVVKSGNTGTVEFVADKVGEFEFYCSVGQHRANGMVGKLIVTE